MSADKLQSRGQGDEEHPVSLDQFFTDCYEPLKKLARGELGRLFNCPDVTATVLVNECYLKLRKSGSAKKLSRLHFFRLAARSMRYHLIDLIRRGQYDKHRVKQTVLRASRITGEDCLLEDLLALDHALARLERIDTRLIELVELRLFLGLSLKEISALTGMSLSQAHRRWHLARALLSNFLNCDG